MLQLQLGKGLSEKTSGIQPLMLETEGNFRSMAPLSHGELGIISPQHYKRIQLGLAEFHF